MNATEQKMVPETEGFSSPDGRAQDSKGKGPAPRHPPVKLQKILTAFRKHTED